MTIDDIAASPASAVTEPLQALSARIAQAEPAEAAGLLSGVLAAGGVLDAVRDLLETAVTFVEQRTEAAGHDPALYAVWHTLRNVADPLHHEASALHTAPRLLGRLPQGPQDSAPKPPPPHAWEQWVPPSAVRDMPAALDAIAERLEADTIPVSAALLLAPVLDPDGGVLHRLSALLASTSRYAHRHGAAPGLWQDLGRAGQDLDDWSQALAGTTAALTQLPTVAAGPARQPARASQTPPPPPAPGDAPGRRR
ncbi:hypothetical protein [Streptomyces sp. HPF1205]|uniref:hypothetical protein n=1 Tax=Streptomyces sp. HPF1205 TaxID=2873262 RepID=UPI001CECB675|nr:hypothetical protein [Streptomyces sp. HPF1205]